MQSGVGMENVTVSDWIMFAGIAALIFGALVCMYNDVRSKRKGE